MAAQTQAQFEQGADGVSGIYAICQGGRIVYVGQSSDMLKRWKSHVYCLRRGTHRNSHLQRIADKHGIGSLSFCVIERVSTDVTAREIYWIEHLSPECNMVLPEDGAVFGHTEQTKQKIGAASRRRWADEEFKRAMSKRHAEVWEDPDFRKRMSDAHKGQKRTEEQRQDISRALVGHKLSDETRKRISQAHKGKKLSESTRTKLAEASRRAWSDPDDRRARSIKNRRYERPERDKLLADLIEHGGYCSLCKVYGIGKNTLKLWCVDYGLPYKAADLKGMCV